ncbi:MAG: CoA transferase [Planctomycetota bacterium]|nr:MAG: CoA transferase [Planctomycetota bacterium]
MPRLLDGVRILEITRMLSGPYCGILLGDLGAEMIKIEQPGTGDPMRIMPPVMGETMAAYYVAINRNKKSITLDLKKPEGKEVFYRLVAESDVVLDNFRAGVLKNLGIDYQSLRHKNPRIISASVSGFGEAGPYKDHPAFDLIFQALSGAMSITGEPGRAPSRLGVPVGDTVGAMLCAQGICAALYRREKTGEGERVEVNLLDAMVSQLTYMAQYYFYDGRQPGRLGSGHQTVVPYQAVKCEDDYIVIAVFVDKFWANFCKVLGIDELTDDERFKNNRLRVENRDELTPTIEKKFLEKPAAFWIEKLRGVGVPCAPIQTIAQVAEDPQVLHDNMIVEIDVPGHGKMKTLGRPIKVLGDEETFSPPPMLGEHTDETLKSLGGYTDEEINSLRQKGVI